MKKINILYIIPTLDAGGAERQLSYIIKGLKREKFRVFLFILNDSKLFLKKEIPGDINVFFNKNHKNMLQIFKKVTKIIKDNNILLIHSFLPLANFYGAMVKLIYFRKIKLITSQRGLHRKIFNRWTIFNLFAHRISDVITVNSYAVKVNCIKFLKVKPGKIRVIYNGFNDIYKEQNGFDKLSFKKELGLKESFPIILSVGRFDKLKGHQTLLKIAEKVLEKREVYFFFIGEGLLKRNLQEYVISKGLDKYIKFLGERNDISKFYSISDIFVLHTYSEGFSNVISEAMLFSKPVITTNISANQEIIDNNVNGFLVEKDEIDEFVLKIFSLLENDDKRKQIGKLAREKIIQNFSIEKMIKSYETLYKEIIKNE